MIPIILCGNEYDERTGRLLCRKLAKYGDVTHITKNKIYYQKSIEKLRRCFVIYEPTASVLDISALCHGIIIFKEKTGTLKSILLPPTVPVIVGSDNYSALKLISSDNRRIITCGISVRDTLSLSANIGGSASVSLQRRIRDMHGKWIAECELPLDAPEGMNDYGILTYTAIRLICKLY